MESVGLISLLGLCSFDDIRSKEIRVIEIGVFGIIGVLLHIFFGKNSWYSMVGGVAVGAIMYLISVLSKEKIGKGDALIIMVAGIYLGCIRTIELLWVSSLLAAIVGIGVVLIKKKNKEYEMPFVPFLLAGYLIIYTLESMGVLL